MGRGAQVLMTFGMDANALLFNKEICLMCIAPYPGSTFYSNTMGLFEARSRIKSGMTKCYLVSCHKQVSSLHFLTCFRNDELFFSLLPFLHHNSER